MIEISKSALRVRRLRARRKQGIVACVTVMVTTEDIVTLRRFSKLPPSSGFDPAVISKAVRSVLDYLNEKARMKPVTNRPQ